MKKVSLFALLLCVFCVSNAIAAAGSMQVTDEDILNAWGVSGVNENQDFCKGTATEAGFDVSNAGTVGGWARYMAKNKTLDENTGFVSVYYIARDITVNGAKFCKTVVAADRCGCTCDPITEYYDVNDKDCFWLCKQGYYGDGCETTTFVTGAIDPATLDARKGIADGKIHPLVSPRDVNMAGSNIENDIQMFMMNTGKNCHHLPRENLSSTKWQEHDTVLALKQIRDSEDGYSVIYTVQPMVVRAGGYSGCYWGGDDFAWPMVAWTGKADETLCPSSGHMHKAKDGGIGCVGGKSEEEVLAAGVASQELEEYKMQLSVAESQEKQGLAMLCPNWPKDKYDNKMHELRGGNFSNKQWRTEEGAQTKDAYVEEQCASSCTTDATNDTCTTCKTKYEKVWDNLYSSVDTACTTFVCKNDLGYASDPLVSGDFSCVECSSLDSVKSVSSRRVGRNAADGVCTVCPVGKLFSRKENTCIKATTLSKHYMMGTEIGPNPNTTVTEILEKEPSDSRKLKKVGDQCWAKMTPDDYKKCIEDYGWANVKMEHVTGETTPPAP